MLGNEAFWEFQKNGTKKSKIDQLYQRKRKGDKDLENVHCSRQKKLETIENPTTNILLTIKVTHGLPPWKIVWVLFLSAVLIGHPICWEIRHVGNSQRMELRK